MVAIENCPQIFRQYPPQRAGASAVKVCTTTYLSFFISFFFWLVGW